MKKLKLIIITILLFYSLVYSQEENKQNKENFIQKIFSETEISGQWFLAYLNGIRNGNNFNEFRLKRGYLTFKESFTNNISTRFTQDISLDREGDGMGDVELRLKYGYLRYEFSSFGIFTNPIVEFGLVHRCWLDFEQKINRYRVQGKMFLERYGILHSADFGLTFMSLLGGEINKDYQKSVSDDYPGKYGSLEFGIYNGGGYHALEQNENKLLEGRITLRPLPNLLPGLQFSYLTGYGKGNTEAAPDFSFNVGFVSYQSESVILTGTYYTGTGNAGGSAVDDNGKPYQNNGFSFFCELFIPKTKFSFIGRWDYFEVAKSTPGIENQNFIGGIAYHFIESSKILLDYDYSCEEDVCDRKTFSFNVEIKF